MFRPRCTAAVSYTHLDVYKRQEQRRIAAGKAGDEGVLVETASDLHEPSAEERELERPRLLWANAALFLAVLVSLFSGVLPAGYIFMIGLCLALLINLSLIHI